MDSERKQQKTRSTVHCPLFTVLVATALAAGTALGQDGMDAYLRSEGGAGEVEFERPRLRVYDDDGRLKLVIDGERAVSRHGRNRVLGVRFHMDLETKGRDVGEAGQTGPALRHLEGQADEARFDAETKTILFEGGVVIRLHAARPIPIAGGAVGRPPAAALRLDRLRYDPKRNRISSSGRVWARLRDGDANTKISGLGMQLDLNARALAIGSDVRFLASGDVLSAGSLLRARRKGEVKAGEPRERARRIRGALITSQHGVRLTGLGRSETGRKGRGAALAVAARKVDFFGPVHVSQEDMTLDCERLSLLVDVQGTRVSAKGNVRIRTSRADPERPDSRPEQLIAEGRQAEWDLPAGAGAGGKRAGKLTLTGSTDDPAEMVHYDADGTRQQVIGTRIRLDLGSGKITID